MKKNVEQQTAYTTAYTGDIPNTPVRFMLYVSSPHKKWMFLAFLAVVVAEMAGTSLPYIFRSIIDTANLFSQGTGSLSDVWFWVMLYPVSLLLMFLGWRSSGFFGMRWITGANATAYQTLFEYLTFHSHTYFTNRFAGSLSSKISHASEGSQGLLEASIWNYFPSVLGLVLTFVYIYFSNANAALLYVGLVVVLVPLNILLARWRRPHVVSYSAQVTKARGYAVDAITNIGAVRQYAQRDEEAERHKAEIQMMRQLNIRQWGISEWSLVINNIVILAFEAAVLFVSIKAWTGGLMSIGELVMILTLMLNLQHTLVFIGNAMNGFVRRYGEIQEGLDEILVPHEIVDQPGATQLISKGGEIQWDGVDFTYGAQQVFGNFNLTILPGQRVGLVGHSGAGKTTFVSLLLRQHDVTGGQILIDGQNIAEVTQDSLRANIAVVPQEPMLFHRSIRESIAYGKPDATLEEIVTVAKKAEAHDFISALPEGYDTLVGERGVKLSGGQKQRVAIARAMLKNAPILILDEATSALDSESEVAIQKALHELMEGKTVIAIAHRLSTLREMDRIIVLESGKILEDGTHLQLTKGKGIYARLWKHQAGGFLQE